MFLGFFMVLHAAESCQTLQREKTTRYCLYCWQYSAFITGIEALARGECILDPGDNNCFPKFSDASTRGENGYSPTPYAPKGGVEFPPPPPPTLPTSCMVRGSHPSFWEHGGQGKHQHGLARRFVKIWGSQKNRQFQRVNTENHTSWKWHPNI